MINLKEVVEGSSAEQVMWLTASVCVFMCVCVCVRVFVCVCLRTCGLMSSYVAARVITCKYPSSSIVFKITLFTYLDEKITESQS